MTYHPGDLVQLIPDAAPVYFDKGVTVEVVQVIPDFDRGRAMLILKGPSSFFPEPIIQYALDDEVLPVPTPKE